MDTYAADVAGLVGALDLKNAVHVGHSTGGGEVAHYVARAEPGRVAKAVLIGAVPPIMVKSEQNPGELPIQVFEGFRAALVAAQVVEATWQCDSVGGVCTTCAPGDQEKSCDGQRERS